MLIGLFNLFAPGAAWFASIGWKIRNVEPSDAYLVMHRIGGGIASIVAVVLLFTGTGHTGASNSEQSIRADIISSPIESVTFQMKPVSSFNSDDVISWIRNSTWDKPAIDYSKQTSFASSGELDLHYADSHEIEIFDMGNDQFGIGQKVFYPEYVFSSPELKKWVSSIDK